MTYYRKMVDNIHVVLHKLSGQLLFFHLHLHLHLHPFGMSENPKTSSTKWFSNKKTTWEHNYIKKEKL